MLTTVTLIILSLGATRTEKVDTFKRIANSSSVDINVQIDPSARAPYTVELEGDEDRLDGVELRVRDGALEVESKGSWNWRGKSPTLSVTVAALEAVALNGSGDFRAKGFVDNPKLEVALNGSGDAAIDGELGDLTVAVSGSGDFGARGIDADEVRVAVQGSGDLKLMGATKSLNIAVAGSGDVDASELRSKQADVKVAGSGDVEVCVEGGAFRPSVAGSGDVENRC